MFSPPAPVTVISSFVPPNSKFEIDPGFSVSPPTVSVPTPVLIPLLPPTSPVSPGARMPPAPGETVPAIVPVPPKVARFATVTVPVEKLPVPANSNSPALTAVPPVCWF